MGKEKLILTAIVAAAIGTGFFFKDNISSYFEQQVQNYQKKQERRIHIPANFFDNYLGTDGKYNFYPFTLKGRDITIEIDIKERLIPKRSTRQDSLATAVDSLVIEPENAIFPYKGKNLPVYKIKEKIN